MLLTNICGVTELASPRALRSRARILAAALDLFEERGYRSTTVAQIAAAAGVTSMTFFRHFPTKDSVLVTDPYDPLIAEAIAAQPLDLPALERVRRGLLAALDGITPVEDATARRRVAVVAGLPELRGALMASTQATQDAIVDRLVGQGVDRLDAAVVTAACLGAISAALLVWPRLGDDVTLGSQVRYALGLLVAGEAR